MRRRSGLRKAAMSQYRERLWQTLSDALTHTGSVATALDFGSGDGWFARKMLDAQKFEHLQTIDVKHRTDWIVPAMIYDGGTLPFADQAFDLSYSIDVLHHCPDPKVQLADVLRCTKRYFLLKDHTYRTSFEFLKLCFFDEVGNRRFGIPSLYRYQKEWEWDPIFEASGFTRRLLIHPADLQDGLIGRFAHGLHFVSLWERA